MEQQSTELFYALQRLASSTHKHMDQMLLERLGIGVSQLRILHVILASQQISQRIVADVLGQTEASISRQIKLLGAKGFIEVRANPKNKREKLVRVTAKGARVTEVANKDLGRSMQQQLSALPEKQQKQLHEILNTLRV